MTKWMTIIGSVQVTITLGCWWLVGWRGWTGRNQSRTRSCFKYGLLRNLHGFIDDRLSNTRTIDGDRFSHHGFVNTGSTVGCFSSSGLRIQGGLSNGASLNTRLIIGDRLPGGGSGYGSRVGDVSRLWSSNIGCNYWSSGPFIIDRSIGHHSRNRWSIIRRIDSWLNVTRTRHQWRAT